MNLYVEYLIKKDEFLKLLEDKNIKAELLKTFIDILSLDEEGINVDLVDIKSVLNNGDEVILRISNDFNKLIKGEEFKSVIVYFIVNENFSLLKIQEFMDIIQDRVDEDGDIIFGSNIDNSLKNNEYISFLLGVK